ncbi:MAG: class I SAM-dependent methyltransferase [Microbacteriaceae bacterium]|nr:class I SAM-dependent methyltransferase [Microbacteriaceae bacterium]MCL2795179.1 class I SAM-dependent methyltransferase [Microbacteriaceae bacterium]
MAENASFDEARAETIRYHRELYAMTDVGDVGTWLARPHGLVLKALELVDPARPIIAYDLGAGVGRHTFAVAERVAAGSTVVAVDLLPEALERLRDRFPSGTSVRLRTAAADLVDFTFDEPVDLVIAFSAVEHLPDLESIERLLGRAAEALSPGGVVAIGIIADRRELAADGKARPALIESGITSEDADALLLRAFSGLEVVKHSRSSAQVTESRSGEDYVLSSTLAAFIARRSA